MVNWVITQHKDRNAIISELSNGLSCSCARGNFLWAIKNEELFLYEIRKNDTWEYNEIPESLFGENQSSCPIAYLSKTKAQNIQWRESLKQKNSSKKELKQTVVNAFKEAKTLDKEFIIEVETLEGEMSLVVESVVPLSGRYRGKLYRIPLRRVKKWKIQ